ncbi:hypothetical protein FEN82_21565 [Salmonella enterica subsp. enterica serovar Typhimurium]|nr:hypothetical protein [Salmonella enterica subsp. enterica serovar Typhimurium]
MEKLNIVVKDGFILQESNNNNELDIAFTSLKIALMSYFTTYQDCHYYIGILEKVNNDVSEEDLNYSNSYCKSCVETIVHFQHFFELVCKKILKDEHPLLANEASKKVIALHKMLKGELLSVDEESSLRSIEFSETITRLTDLIKKERINDYQKLGFIHSNIKVLTELNVLRNRIWHRGLYILRYKALDEFVCNYILPLVIEFVSLEQFSDNERLWKYKPLICNISIIDELIKEYKSTASVNTRKIALLKELGRAAYNNPLTDGSLSSHKMTFARIVDNEIKSRTLKIVDAITQHEHASVKNCPVCGMNTLIAYKDSEQEFDDEENLINSYDYTYRLVCECCGLSLNSGFSEAKIYGLTGIGNLWD